MSEIKADDDDTNTLPDGICWKWKTPSMSKNISQLAFMSRNCVNKSHALLPASILISSGVVCCGGVYKIYFVNPCSSNIPSIAPVILLLAGTVYVIPSS